MTSTEDRKRIDKETKFGYISIIEQLTLIEKGEKMIRSLEQSQFAKATDYCHFIIEFLREKEIDAESKE
jgi:hypothetical protein